MKKLRSFFIFFIPFLLFFFYFTNESARNHSTAHSSHTEHGLVEIPEGYAVPSISLFVTQDGADTWLLEVQTKNFRFKPKKVGDSAPSYNEGHAHLYINGEKITRLYGKYYHLGTLKQGKNHIKVTLNSNNHSLLINNGKVIETSTVVEVSS